MPVSCRHGKSVLRASVLASFAALLLAGCASHERRPVDPLPDQPVAGAPRHIFRDPIGYRDRTISQRLGALDIPTPRFNNAVENERAAASRARLAPIQDGAGSPSAVRPGSGLPNPATPGPTAPVAPQRAPGWVPKSDVNPILLRPAWGRSSINRPSSQVTPPAPSGAVPERATVAAEPKPVAAAERPVALPTVEVVPSASGNSETRATVQGRRSPPL